MEFQKRKEQTLAALSSPSPDKSPKGGVDAPIVPLLEAINRHPYYFTTSSCSGRISILCHTNPNHNPSPSTQEVSNEDKSNNNNKKTTTKKKAGGGGWVFVSHEPADPDAVVDILFKGHQDETLVGGDLVCRFEPLIIAVDCRDAAAAQELVSSAISSGFRESGITSLRRRVMVAIRCSIRLEVPLGQLGKIIVSPDYIRYLVRIANDKMEVNKKRADGFLRVLQTKGLPKSAEDITHLNERHVAQLTDEKLSLELVPKLPEGHLVLVDGNDKDKCADQPADISSVLKNGSVAVKCCDQDNTLDFGKDEGALSSAGSSGNDKGAEDFNSSLKASNCKDEGETGPVEDTACHALESSGMYRCCISVALLKITGEPIEKIFLWGHSSCALNSRGEKELLVFGGFGGIGRHARRNYTLMLNPQSGLLREMDAKGPPSKRLGHSATIVGNNVYVIGGRTGPSQILNDVWVLQTPESRWLQLGCTGDLFKPRHRHTAVAVGSYIYVFGGLSGEVIYNCLSVLNTETLHWHEVCIEGEWPCARHSHSSVAYGSQFFMFGGHDGEKALDDLHSFDIRTLQWKKEKTTGKAPSPRFSHSMFIYKTYLGIIGGCPVKQHYQDLVLLNLHHRVWLHVTVESLSKNLWVRSSTVVIDDDLFVLGGGASCYAFGTKFNQPMKINLQFLESVHDFSSDEDNKPLGECNKVNHSTSSKYNKNLQGNTESYNSIPVIDMSAGGDRHYTDAKQLVLQLEKKYAKVAKDILKKFGWLDLTRKVVPNQDGCFIKLPINTTFKVLYLDEQLNSKTKFGDLDQFHQLGVLFEKEIAVEDVPCCTALKILLSCGGSLLNDDLCCKKKPSKSPRIMMRESISLLLKTKGMPLQLLEQLPTRWEHLGDMVVLPKSSFKDALWDSVREELWPIVAKSLGAQRLARQGRILPSGTRDSTLELLVGNNGWVTHQENGILYSLDATKCMFSSGNRSEKLRMARLDCTNEIIVDLFAGIGYFVLPFLVKANAKLVYACEWNSHALEALEHNINANFVADRCVILKGDNRVIAPKGVADRVCLGLLPSSECSWVTAVRALRVGGGILHVHGNVNDSEESSWIDYVVRSISGISESEGLLWDVSVQHLERVKWYGPHIRHLVADVRCKQL
ncbi:tRNA wybutosine-synthesizing protein 2/3/4 [Typha angustifolia]|uniref:tRNA wybutosine-synthesizing protein 2/3/4 n=1 Tax=Typha angustifolia TaxID=59011 RepID=UPI003C30AD67